MDKQTTIQETSSNKNIHLILSIALDLFGMASYLLPALGESTDVIFAPIYGLAIFWMYKKRKISGIIGGVIGTVEEWLPATDLLPTATIMWFYTYVLTKDEKKN